MPSVITKPIEFVKSLQVLTRRRHCFIRTLSQDVWVNHIFPDLFIEDILSIRQTCVHFFRLTHEPVIWKRFLLALQFPIPALRPSFSWSDPRANHEIEQIVARAISLDFNFRAAPPKMFKSERLVSSYHHTSVKILPGGRHVFACFRDKSGYRRGFLLYDMDNPRYRTYMTVAKVETQSNPIDLEAKYVWFDGRYGIMVSYIQRKFVGSSADGYQPDDFTADTTMEVDWPANLMYTSRTYFLDMNEMDQIVDPFVVTPLNLLPSGGCYEEISSLQDDHPLSNPSLFTWNGGPHLALQEGTTSLIFQDLTTETRELVRMTPQKELGPDWDVRSIAIRAFRVLPTEESLDVMVILTVKQVFIEGTKSVDANYVEIFEVPSSGHQNLVFSKRSMEIDPNCYVSKYRISEPATYFYAGVDHPEVLTYPRCGPVPLSIFAEVAEPRGIHHHTVWPAHIPLRHSRSTNHNAYIAYDLTYVNSQSVHRLDDTIRPLVLPGCERAVVLLADAHDRTDHPKVSQIRRYINPGLSHLEYERPEYGTGLEDLAPSPLRAPRPMIPMRIYDTFRCVPRDLKKALEENGLVGASWDEGSGRMAVIAVTERGQEVFLVDLCHFRKGDIRDRFSEKE